MESFKRHLLSLPGANVHCFYLLVLVLSMAKQKGSTANGAMTRKDSRLTGPADAAIYQYDFSPQGPSSAESLTPERPEAAHDLRICSFPWVYSEELEEVLE